MRLSHVGFLEPNVSYCTNGGILRHVSRVNSSQPRLRTQKVFFTGQLLIVGSSSDKTIGTPIAGWFSAKPTFDVIEKECGADYFQ